MVLSGREILTDQRFDADVVSADFSNKLFLRIDAKGRSFECVDFRYTVFDACYFRKCTFNSCDFTGCRFKESNFVGATFSGCKFEYASFDKTTITNEILDFCAPSWENVQQTFARTLRMNYQSLGDVESANKAFRLELSATGRHLKDAWLSPKSYYRGKYGGLKRILKFFEWAKFKFLGYFWGHGESLSHLTFTVLIVWILMAAIDAALLSPALVAWDIWDSFWKMPPIAFGVLVPADYPRLYLVAISFIRLVYFGLFMSYLVRRLSRR